MSLFDQFTRNIGREPEDAKFFWAGGPVEVAERTYFASAFSGVTAFETDEGIVLVDSGLRRLSPMIAAMIRQRTKAPIHTAIFTQGHVDHAFGLEAPSSSRWDRSPPRVHRASGDARALRALPRGPRAYNKAINARQFGATRSTRRATPRTRTTTDTFGTPAIAADRSLRPIGDRSRSGRACASRCITAAVKPMITRWVYLPGPPRPLYGRPLHLGRRRTRATLRRCSAIRGSGPADCDRWRISRARSPLSRSRRPEDRRARAHREDAPRDGRVSRGHRRRRPSRHSTTARRRTWTSCTTSPSPVSDSPWLQCVYDDAEFIVRNVIRFFGGWYSGRPSELKPPPRDATRVRDRCARGRNRTDRRPAPRRSWSAVKRASRVASPTTPSRPIRTTTISRVRVAALYAVAGGGRRGAHGAQPISLRRGVRQSGDALFAEQDLRAGASDDLANGRRSRVG